MTGIFAWLFRFIALASLLLLLTTSAMWARSHFRADRWSRQHGDAVNIIQSSTGEITCRRLSDAPVSLDEPWQWTVSQVSQPESPPEGFLGTLGFGSVDRREFIVPAGGAQAAVHPFEVRQQQCWVPYWFISLVTALPAAAWLIRTATGRRRMRAEGGMAGHVRT